MRLEVGGLPAETSLAPDAMFRYSSSDARTLGGLCWRSESVSGKGGLACDHARKDGARSGEVIEACR